MLYVKIAFAVVMALLLLFLILAPFLMYKDRDDEKEDLGNE